MDRKRHIETILFNFDLSSIYQNFILIDDFGYFKSVEFGYLFLIFPICRIFRNVYVDREKLNLKFRF